MFLGPDDHRRGLGGEDRFLTAAGFAGPGVDVEIVDEDGRTLGPGRPGEVCVRGDQVFAGYRDDPDATDGARRDGSLRTGDIGVLAEDGLLAIVDRAKDIIVTGGENVASREVEDVIGGHPQVARVAVVGLADERWGEAVCAVVVARPDSGRDAGDLEAEILRLTRSRLAGFKVPKRVVFVDDLPVNSSGKVVKADVRRQLVQPGGDPRRGTEG